MEIFIKYGMQVVGYELDEKYFEIAKERLLFEERNPKLNY